VFRTTTVVAMLTGPWTVHLAPSSGDANEDTRASTNSSCPGPVRAYSGNIGEENEQLRR
jgi:hypothetical protein